MRMRCSNPDNASWKYYGAKGIKVCPEWQASFEAFLRDLGPAPTPLHQLDRIDNGRDYEPDNVVWGTAQEQQENTSKVIYLTVMGVTLPRHVWARLFGLPVNTLASRIKNGWTHEDAVRTPINEACRPGRRFAPGGSLKRMMREQREAQGGQVPA